MTLSAYSAAEDLEKNCLKKLEAARADVVKDKVEIPLLMCLKEVVQLLRHGDPAKCTYLGKVKLLEPHYKVDSIFDLVLLGANK